MDNQEPNSNDVVADLNQATSAAPVDVTVPEPKKPKRQRATKPASNAAKAAKPRARRLSDQEKLEKITEIEAHVTKGSTLKQAVEVAGISDQTYYQWKKSVAQPASNSPATSIDAEFAEFQALEAENRRLRNLLAEKLRAENADLRKRLGLD